MRLLKICLACSIVLLLSGCSTARKFTPMGALYYLPTPPQSMFPMPAELAGYTGPIFKGTDKNGQSIIIKATSDMVILWPLELQLREKECRE